MKFITLLNFLEIMIMITFFVFAAQVVLVQWSHNATGAAKGPLAPSGAGSQRRRHREWKEQPGGCLTF